MRHIADFALDEQGASRQHVDVPQGMSTDVTDIQQTAKPPHRSERRTVCVCGVCVCVCVTVCVCGVCAPGGVHGAL